MKQGLVSILQGRQSDELLEVIGFVAKLLELQRHLFFDGKLARGEESFELQGPPLFRGKRQVLVEHRIVK